MFAGAKFTVGFRTPGEHRHHGYDIAVDHGSDVHELENYRRLVRAIGVDPSHLPSLGKIGLRDRSGPCDAGPIVFHMWPGGSGAELKEWPPERWLTAADLLIKDGRQLVLTGSPEQHPLNESFISSLSPSVRRAVRNVAGQSLTETARILAQASLVVSVNTGIMHMAAAVQVPLVALHGPTNVERWGPISDRAISVISPLAGCGYLNLGFEYPRRHPPACMNAISIDTVLSAIHFAHERLALVPERKTAEDLPYSLKWDPTWSTPSCKPIITTPSAAGK
jgi:ADP-heptose:LPS heptosyltransferase